MPQRARYTRPGHTPGACRWCGAPLPPRRRTLCSPACVHAYRLRTDRAYLRAQAIARDNGHCTRCGCHATAIAAGLRTLTGDALAERLASLGIPDTEAARAFVCVHHSTRVADGGGGCGLDNVVTLCYPCHAAVHRPPPGSSA